MKQTFQTEIKFSCENGIWPLLSQHHKDRFGPMMPPVLVSGLYLGVYAKIMVIFRLQFKTLMLSTLLLVSFFLVSASKDLENCSMT